MADYKHTVYSIYMISGLEFMEFLVYSSYLCSIMNSISLNDGISRCNFKSYINYAEIAS